MKALPKMAQSASSEALSKAITEHLEVTKKQAERLERIFEMLGEEARSKPCAGMKGIIQEAEEHLEEEYPEGLADAVIIGGRKIEYYEMAGYSAALELAQMIGNQQVVRLIKQTLGEEERTDKKLAGLSTRLLKQSLREAA